jgi:hypothetical protein
MTRLKAGLYPLIANMVVILAIILPKVYNQVT